MPQTAQQIPISNSRAADPGLEPRIGIVLVNYNCLTDTIRCLDSLSRLDYRNYFVVLVDNASPDGSGEQLKDFASNTIRIICNPENKGFAAGNNVGIHQARSMGARYIWLLNPDTEVAPDALRALVEELHTNPVVAATGSKILYGEGTPEKAGRIWGAGGTVDPQQQQIEMRGNDALDEGQFDVVEDCGYLPGCSILVRTSVIKEIGLLPEEYFMYFEETDWCQRMRKASYRLHYVPSSVVYHHFSDPKMQTAFTVYYYNRNNRLFWWRYSNSKLRVIRKTLLKELPSALRALFAAESAEHRQLFIAHTKSCLDFLLGRFGKRQV